VMNVYMFPTAVAQAEKEDLSHGGRMRRDVAGMPFEAFMKHPPSLPAFLILLLRRPCRYVLVLHVFYYHLLSLFLDT
jgi:hypothetical protein